MRPFTLHLHQDTARDFLVSTDGDVERSFWLRKDYVEVESRWNGQIVCRIPDWLAKERGLRT